MYLALAVVMSYAGVSSIRRIQSQQGQSVTDRSGTFSVAGTRWLLRALGEKKALANVKATLVFSESGAVSGNASCNHFFGSAAINGTSIKLGRLAATRMACSEPIMEQEDKYLSALAAAEGFEWRDPYLLLYCKGFEKPLRFTREVD